MLEPLKDWVKKRYTEMETVLANKKTKLKQSHFSFPMRTLRPTSGEFMNRFKSQIKDTVDADFCFQNSYLMSSYFGDS
jgi:hypothetical protein